MCFNKDKKLDKKTILLLCVLGISFLGLYYSKTVLSFVPYLVLLMGLYQKKSRDRVKLFFKSPAILSLSLILFVYLLSGINSSDTSMWLGRVNTNLIFFVIPFAIFLNGPYDRKFVNIVLEIFVSINFIISVLLLFSYFFNYDEVNSSYLKGQTIHTPIIHVRYSYFVALSILFSAYLFMKSKIKLKRYAFGTMALFLMVFIHVMAVRTGILSLYLSTVFLAFYNAIVYKKYKLAIAVLGIILGIMVMSYLFLPSVKNKIKYVKWDIETTLNGTAKYHTSDRIRITSIINGFKILKDSPLLGSGIGDIEKEMNKKYELNYKDLPKEMRFQPVNQFVFTLSSMGILGFVLYYLLLLFPVFYTKNRHELLIPVYVLTLLTFVGETTIELMIGKTAFLTLLAILICYKKEI